MFEKIRVRQNLETPLLDFFQVHSFFVEQVTDKVLRVNRTGEVPVFLNVDEKTVYFEVDLGNIAGFANEELYFKLLDLNTEILPVSVGINSTKKADPRLVLVESREVKNLDENELLTVFAALELAVDKVEEVLSEYLK
ncbi:MAG TPA: CesT family type III secretion system chaperone [Spirochaetia bacterium]|nr:CesT family type III secretion system chaperone [Spirochaetia bacterium]